MLSVLHLKITVSLSVLYMYLRLADSFKPQFLGIRKAPLGSAINLILLHQIESDFVANKHR